MPDLRHRIVVRGYLPIGCPLSELVRIGCHVVRVIVRNSFRRVFLHLVRAHIHGLYELPLESSLTAVTLQGSLVGADSSDCAARGTASQRPSAGSAGLRVVYAEIGVVSQ